MFKYYKIVRHSILLLIIILLSKIAINKIIVHAENITSSNANNSGITDFSSMIEKQIRSGFTSTADLIVSHHPRIWLRGPEDWDKDKFGSYAWRIIHGPAMSIRYPAYGHDDLKYIFYFCAAKADKYFDRISWHDTHVRLISLITTGKSVAMKNEWNLPLDLPSSSKNPDYNPKHTGDEYFIRAKEKLLALANSSASQLHSNFIVQVGAAAYDWLMGETLENGEPVFSKEERNSLQNRLIAHADFLKSQCTGNENFFQSKEIYNYMYPQVGMALYEPDGQGISAVNNAKAKHYLDDFDKYWIGKILPALNLQGGDGGWHGGITRTTGKSGMQGGTHPDNTIPTVIAPLLFAHFTATGKPIEQSIFSTGFLKCFIEWQLYMIPPCEPGFASYYPVGGEWQNNNRSPWTFPRRTFARRRASQDNEQLKLAELGAWLGYKRSNYCIGYGGSWDMQNKLLFEDNWVNPRNPDQLGYGTRHFKKLGWVFMREGFVNPNNVSAIFVCQRYRWSHLDDIAQNSFYVGRKEELIKGWDNTILIDNDGQRTIDNFPTLIDGLDAYAPGSEYDIGPGIKIFENNSKYSYILGDATNAYDKKKVKKNTREIVYIKPDIFVIFDCVETIDPGYKKKWVIHTSTTPIVIDESQLVIKNESSALWIKRLLPANVDQTLHINSIDLTTIQKARKDYFLFVLQVTDSNLSHESPKLVTDQAELISDQGEFGVVIDKWKILLTTTEPKGIRVTNMISGSY